MGAVLLRHQHHLKTAAMEAESNPLNKLIEENNKNHESELKTHKEMN